MISVLANKSRRAGRCAGRRSACSSTSRSAWSTARCSSATIRAEREIVGLSQSSRTESYWTVTTITEPDTAAVAVVVLHSGVFKESYAGYPQDRLA